MANISLPRLNPTDCYYDCTTNSWDYYNNIAHPWHWEFVGWAEGFVPHFDINDGNIKHIYYLLDTNSQCGYIWIPLGSIPNPEWSSAYVSSTLPIALDQDGTNWRNYTEKVNINK